MGFKADGIIYTDFPTMLGKEVLDKLPTPRLLCHFKKFRSSYYALSSQYDVLDAYFEMLKCLLEDREHIS